MHKSMLTQTNLPGSINSESSYQSYKPDVSTFSTLQSRKASFGGILIISPLSCTDPVILPFCPISDTFTILPLNSPLDLAKELMVISFSEGSPKR